MKEKSSTARPGKMIRKLVPTKNLPNLSSRPASLQTATLSAPGEPLKKVVKQPLAGAAQSRITANAKRPITESTKASAISSNKSHTPETKLGSKSGKSRPSDAKKNATLEIKPKENEIGKTKLADKTGVKTAVAKEKAQNSDQVSINAQCTKLLQSPVASTDLSSLSNTQKAGSPSHPEDSFKMEDKNPLSPKIPQIPENSFQPQIPEDNGLLDGIEEPMKVRKISMDFSNNDMNLGENFLEEKTGTHGKQFDPLDSALSSEDTLLLDSTPMTPSAPSVISTDVIQNSSDASSSSKESHDYGSVSKTAAHNREVIHKGSLQDLFGDDISPFMAGLVTGIVDDPSTTLQKLPSVNNNEPEIPKSSETLLSLNKLNNGTLEQVQDNKGDETERTMILREEVEKIQASSGIKREEFSIRSSGSSDSVNAQPDPALDEVIDSLFEASKMVDNARKTADELEHHIQDVTTQVINNTHSIAAADITSCMEQLTTVKDVFDGQVTSITHDINDNANALANQNAYEEKRAEEMYLPPMTSAARARAKPVVNGVKTKPKLSQPLYFDIVFVPHHGAHPILKDEEAAKAFVTSIRS
ncbi:unnamed protein product, partial [Onchocerca ochengi]|uniref:DUF4596 domain-containing protein n=1 Tax=Onchocerca ochengi TaxID=42157 RepID=A0A182EPF1_ONCOC